MFEGLLHRRERVLLHAAHGAELRTGLGQGQAGVGTSLKQIST